MRGASRPSPGRVPARRPEQGDGYRQVATEHTRGWVGGGWKVQASRTASIRRLGVEGPQAPAAGGSVRVSRKGAEGPSAGESHDRVGWNGHGRSGGSLSGGSLPTLRGRGGYAASLEAFMSRLLSLSYKMVVATAFLMLSCGPGRPSDADGEAHLRANVGDGERLQVASFRKTDGISAEQGGVLGYTMLFEAEAAFRENAMYSAGTPFLSQASSIEVAEYQPPSRGFSWSDFMAASQGWRAAGEGDLLRLEGEIRFERRESGWHATSLSLTFAHDSTMRAPGVTLQTRDDLFAALVSDLKNLASQQEIYYSQHYTYTEDQGALGYAPALGVMVAVQATARGWSGVAKHAQLPDTEGCAVLLGQVPGLPLDVSLQRRPRSGEIVCSGGARAATLGLLAPG